MRSFSDFHPAAVAACLLSCAGVCMFRMEPAVIAISLIGALVTCGAVRTGGAWRVHAYTAALCAGMALINPLVSHQGVTVLFVFNRNPVTLESFLYGVAAAGMVAAVLHWFRAFSAVMTTDKLLCLFGRLSPKMALMLSMALRYVPLFQRQAGDVRRSQTALGLYKEDDLPDRFIGGVRIFSVMTTWALENGVITADSMAARGYGTGRRSQFSIFRWTKADGALLALALLLLGVTVWGLSGHEFTFYPAISAGTRNLRAMTGYGAYALLAGLPAIIQGMEAARWRFLTSRI